MNQLCFLSSIALSLCSAGAVCFEDLYSLRAPVGNVEGFDISAFDREVSHLSTCQLCNKKVLLISFFHCILCITLSAILYILPYIPLEFSSFLPRLGR